MAHKIQIKRGNKADLPTLDVGEFGLCQDTNELFIGNNGNQKIFPPTAPTISDVEGLQTALDNKVDNSRVLTNVPVNAKFTDTTYSEISTSEIDAGTSSTLRTITGRRVKYLLDKVQGWINALTKSDIGLGNVENYGIATQAEAEAGTSNTRYTTPLRVKQAINIHNTDAAAHDDIRQQINNLDANKVDNSRVLTDVPVNAKFTDTVTTINGKTGAIAKADIVALGIPAQDTVYTHPDKHAISEVDGLQTALNGKVNTSQVLTNVPAGAVFTDTVTTINGKTGAISKADIVALGIPSQDTNTTYSEITTSEIDAGTSSTLRTITGRRVKYLLDKVQGWINALTKSDIGLGDVENYSIATQSEAESGTANNRYMTPLRTKQAINTHNIYESSHQDIRQQINDLDAEVVAHKADNVQKETEDPHGAYTEFSERAVNVKWYGAVGDGVTDDTTAIQNAITNNDGRTVYFPPGEYKITSTLNLPKISQGKLTRLVGSSRWNTKLKYYGSSPCINAKGTTSDRVYFEIHDLNIQNESVEAQVVGIDMEYNTPRSLLNRVSISGFFNNIQSGDNWSISLYEVRSTYAEQDGLDLSLGTNNNFRIFGGEYLDCGRYNLHLRGRNHIVMGPDVSGGSVGLRLRTCRGGVFSCYIENSGIEVDGCQGGVALNGINFSNWSDGQVLLKIFDSRGVAVNGFNCEKDALKGGTAIHIENSNGVSLNGIYLNNISKGVYLKNTRGIISGIYFHNVTTPIECNDHQYVRYDIGVITSNDYTNSVWGNTPRLIVRTEDVVYYHNVTKTDV